MTLELFSIIGFVASCYVLIVIYGFMLRRGISHTVAKFILIYIVVFGFNLAYMTAQIIVKLNGE